MKCKTGKKGNSGFTLVEVLAATGILVILLALGTVAVVYYARWLKITELDNTAREIYLAAENRALLLATGGRLEDSVIDASGTKLNLPEADGGTGISPLAAGEEGSIPDGTLYYIYYNYKDMGGPDATILSDLLPRGTIDPALRDGCFYVVYDVHSGSVTDVFYAEDNELLEENPDKFEDFYIQWRNASRSNRLGAKKMIGYYGGESAGLEDGVPLSPPSILIINGEELLVQLVYNAPMGETVTPEVRLAYDGAEIDLSNSPAKLTKTETSTGGITTYAYTWVVDTLAGSGPQFKNLFTGVAGGPTTFGGDFTVTAKLTQGGFSSPEVSDKNNSLFAEGSGDGTAYIENLRHLQNLDREFSKVKDKTAAEQIADIDCAKSIFAGYEFKPIKNDQLVSYCGSHAEEGEAAPHFIKGLTVTKTSVSGKNGGLFSEVYGAGANPWKFKDVRLINTSITALESDIGKEMPAGALVGVASDALFENCWVYWEPEDQGDLTADGGVIYQILGSTAGGMVGMLEDGTIEDCLAATLVKGNDIAGGLIGSASGTVTVTHSYADCYLTGKTAAGLIGNVESGGAVALNNVYTAGFIYNTQDSHAAGLCNGTVKAQNAYAVMHYEDTTGSITALAGGLDSDDGNNCHYLQYAVGQGGMSYKEMIETGFVTEMNGNGGEFESKTPDQSHPYNLLEGMALTVYPFPGLKDLPHYGDWNAEFVTPALAYFEQYQLSDGTPMGYGFYGGNVSCLRDDCVVPLDGYAVALREADVDALDEEGFTITYRTGPNGAGQVTDYTKGNLYTVEYEGETYYLAPLPDELINSTAVSENFYQYLSFQIEGDDPVVSAYCPHFAKTAVAMPTNMGETAFMNSMTLAADSLRTFVRTPRHLYMLSKYSQYYHTNKLGRQYTFLQELDLDYTTYTGYGLFEGVPFDQDPIGSYAQSFNGVYNGGCRTIRNVRFQLQENSDRLYAGLFGYSTGSLRNVVYLMDADHTLRIAKDTGANLYLGGLAGGSSGSITNCAVAGVNLRGEVYRTTNVYLGGLVGENGGTILNSAAESALLSTSSDNFGYAYAGGLVGSNTGSGKISASYAVGRITADVDRTSNARVCGFVGSNAGDISGSYAAVNLQSSGSGVETYGFCGEKRGTQSGTFFLNYGNFSYRDTIYNASYVIRTETKASPITYQDLTEGSSDGYVTLSAAGMSLGVKGAYDPNHEGADYPYPSGVKDANGKPVHYGRWPQQLDLGVMGVYYWEKLEIEGRTSYDVSLLAVDPDTQTVTKQTTLSNARSDNGVVTDYGYGYYEAANDDGNHVELTPAGIYYTDNGAVGVALELSGTTHSDGSVNAQLEQLMPGYTFYSWHSFVPNPTPGKTDIVCAGLYSVGSEGSPNGTVTLSRDGVSATFEINPHFADALALKTWPEGWTELENAEVTTSPGTSNANPYEVRAMGQLSAINWNEKNLDTKTVMVGWVHTAVQDRYTVNTDRFPYLSTSNDTGKYVWKQTHDINGNGGVYTPIAEYYTMYKHGDLLGWFGGTFDGDDYVIEDVNIQGQTSSVAGLFGVVLDGTLKNIVLYSSDGKGYVTASFDTDTMLSVDYYMGTLAGLAATSSGGTTAIENCSAAGYTINYKTYNVIDNKLNVTRQPGGSGVGGLLGMSNMNLINCSAVTTIRILANPDNKHGNDNLRAGGLVGIAQKTIENCYAGGQITVGGTLDENGEYKEGGVVLVKGANGLFFGGIVAGNYFAGLDNVGVASSGNIKLENCYSYVVLPSQKETKLKSTTTQENTEVEDTSIRALYVLGGKGDSTAGTCTITNCYYLESVVMKNNPDGFDTTTRFNGGSNDTASGGRGTFNLYTDVPYVDYTVRLGGGTTQTLTAADVGKTFTIDCAMYAGWYTRTFNGVSNIKCRFFYQTDNRRSLVPGDPIFTLVDGNGNYSDSGQSSGPAKAVFQGWMVSDGGNGGSITVTDDPSTLYNSSGLLPITYAQLSGADPIAKDGVSQYISKLLPDFGWVTKTTADGFAIPGKYSYSCSNDLQGLNYPFPTILTRESGSINVHYGDWPLYGIERTNGGAPIELNLFSSGKEWTEQLWLSTGIPGGGTWEIVTPSAESAAIATAEVKNGILTVTGISRGLTEVTVRYTTAAGVSYDLTITVRVDAVLQIQPESTPVYLFTGDTTVVRLHLCDVLGNQLNEDVLTELTVNLDKSLCGSNRLLNQSALGKDAEGYYLKLTSVSGLEDEALSYDLESLSINVNYTYQGVEYEDISAINICVVEPTVETYEDTGYGLVAFSLPQAGQQAGVKVTSAKTDSEGTVVLPDTDNGLELNQLRLEGFEAGEVTVTATLEVTPEGAGDGSAAQTHTVTVVVTIPETEPGTTESEEPTPTQSEEPEPGPGPEPNPAQSEAPEPGPGPEPNPAQSEEPEAEPTPEPGSDSELDPDPEAGQEPTLEPGPDSELDPDPEAGQEPQADPTLEPGPDNELDPDPEVGQEPQAEPGEETAAVPGADVEDAQVAETGLKQKMCMGAAVKRLLGAERKMRHGTNLEKAVQSKWGVHSARFIVLSAVRNGGGIGADGSGVQRG